MKHVSLTPSNSFYSNPASALHLHRELSELAGNWENVFDKVRKEFSSANRPEKLPNPGMACLMWYATNGQYGRNILHMLPISAVLDVLQHKGVDKAIKAEFVHGLQNDPNPDSEAIWKSYTEKYPNPPVRKIDTKAVEAVLNGLIGKTADYIREPDSVAAAQEIAELKAQIAKLEASKTQDSAPKARTSKKQDNGKATQAQA